MAEVKWIKIVVDIFNDDKIKLIEQMPEADTILVIWLKILCLAGRANHSGMLIMSERIYYTDEMLSSLFNRPLTIVRMSLDIFEKFGMIEYIDSTISVANWEKHQNIEGMEKIRSQSRERVARHRANKMLCSDVTLQETLRNTDVTQQNKNKNKKENKSKKENKDIYGEFQNVLLSPSEYLKLQERFPLDLASRIERLSVYISSKGAKYSSHYATIIQWSLRDAPSVNSKINSVKEWANG